MGNAMRRVGWTWALVLAGAGWAMAATDAAVEAARLDKEADLRQAEALRSALERGGDPARLQREMDAKAAAVALPGRRSTGDAGLLADTPSGLPQDEADRLRYRHAKDLGTSIPMDLALRVNASMTVTPYDESLRQGGGSPLTAVPIPDTNLGAEFTDHGNTAILSDYIHTVPYTYSYPCPITPEFFGNDAWYRFTLTQPTRVTASTCSDVFHFDTIVGLFDEGLNQVSGNDDACGPTIFQSKVVCCLDPGVYYVVVDGFSGAAGEYDLSVAFDACPPTPPCESAEILPIPTDGSSVLGDWVGQPDLNGDGLGDRLYIFTLPAERDLAFTTCLPGTTVQARSTLYRGASGPCGDGELLYDEYGWTPCPHSGHATQWLLGSLPAGTYTLLVSSIMAAGEGALEMQLTASLPQVDSCPPGVWGHEAEEPCADTNGGCNDATPGPEDYQFIYPGHYCGTAHAYGARDTDWYAVSLGSPGTITYTMNCQAMPMQAAITTYDPMGCSYTVLENTTFPAHSTGTVVTECLPAGTYVVYAAPNAYSGFPCNPAAPFRYNFTVQTEPCDSNPACQIYAADPMVLHLPGEVWGTTVGAPDVQGPNGLDGIGDVGASLHINQSGRYRLTTCLAGSDQPVRLSLWAGSPCLGGVRLTQQGETGLDPCALTLELESGSYWLNVSGVSGEGAFEVAAERLRTPTTGGPDATGYTWISSQDPQGPAYSWTEISATGTNLNLNGDDVGTTVALPFAFPYYGSTYTSATVSSNGTLSFTSPQTPYFNQPIPQADGFGGFLAPFWDDLMATSNVFYLHDAANSRVIFQWNGSNHFVFNGSTFTFQAILHADGRVVFQYLDTDLQFTQSATAGLESPGQTDGLMIHYNDYGARLTPGTAITILPPGQRPTEGGPDLYGYRWRSSLDLEGPQYQWQDISATGTAVVLTDDGVSPAIPLGISFPFYGQARTSIHIGSNGLLGFNPTNLAQYANGTLPDATSWLPNDIICPFWDDLNPPAGGAIYYQSQPALGRFIVQYQGIQHYPSSPNPYIFQAILWSNGEILFQYQNVTAGGAGSATVGVENATGSVGLAARVENTGSLLQDGMAILFAPVALCTVPHVSLRLDAATGGLVLEIPDDGGLATDYQILMGGSAHGTFAPTLTVPNGPGSDQIALPATADATRCYKVVAVCP